MITCDLAQTVLCLGLLFTSSLWLIYLIVLMLETMGLMFYPAKNALIPQLVETRDLAVATGLPYTTQQARMPIVAVSEAVVRFVIEARLPIVSFLVGPLQPYLLGPRTGVLLDSGTFLVSA